MDTPTEAGLERLGWLLFTGCAIAYLVSAVRAGDGYALIGSLLFLAADACFLTVVLRRRGADR